MDRYTLCEFEDYIKDYPDSLFELIDGEIVKKEITEQQGKIILTIGTALKQWQKSHEIKGHYSRQASHRLVDDNYNERRPDVSFRYTDERVSNKTALYSMPDFAVEVKSDENSYDGMREKARFYLANGTRLVWLVYPSIRIVEVHFTDNSVEFFQLAETLSGIDILPDFDITITEIFFNTPYKNYPRYGLTWVIGYELDNDKLMRMEANFPKPNKIPYVAWFMSGVEYYENIEAYKTWARSDLSEYLFDTGSGITSFGRLKIWVNWFHYMLPFLIQKASQEYQHIGDIFEFFERLYPHEIFEEYLGFRNDIFDTFGKIIMQDYFWKDGDLIKPDWTKDLESWNPEWYEEDTLYSSLEFCVKYLEEREISYWVKSFSNIEGKIWTIQIRYWAKKLMKSSASYNIPYERAEFFLNELRKYPAYADV